MSHQLKLRNYHTLMKEEFELVAKTFHGLEEVLAKELTELGAKKIDSVSMKWIWYPRKPECIEVILYSEVYSNFANYHYFALSSPFFDFLNL